MSNLMTGLDVLLMLLTLMLLVRLLFSQHVGGFSKQTNFKELIWKDKSMLFQFDKKSLLNQQVKLRKLAQKV